MKTRESILSRLGKAAHPVTSPERWHGRWSGEDMVTKFADTLRSAHGEVYCEASLPDAIERLGNLLAHHAVRQVVANEEPPLEDLDLPAVFPKITWHTPPTGGSLNKERPAWRQACSQADAGITGAELLLAETGTLVLTSGRGKSRLVSLLPPLHIALVSTSRLAPDIFTWADGLQSPWPANTILISGPSKTGDIEQTLSVGVHGPKKLAVILYETLR